MHVGGKAKPWRTCFCLHDTLPFTGPSSFVPFGTCRATDSNGIQRWAHPCTAPALGSCRRATGQTAEAARQTAEAPGSHPTAALLGSSRLTRAALASLARLLPTLRDDGTRPFTIRCYQLLPPTPLLKLFVNANAAPHARQQKSHLQCPFLAILV